MSEKDKWNATFPSGDKAFAKYVNPPELAGLLPGLYPGVFPNLKAFNDSPNLRTDLHAILLTGIPKGIVPGFSTYTGAVEADLLRLNLAIAPTTDPSKQSNLGVLGGDAAGFPNGRRLIDDVTTIEIRAVAGLTIPLTHPTYKKDDILTGGGGFNGNSDLLRDGTSNTNPALLNKFPYLGAPAGGYQTAPPVPNKYNS